MVKKNNPVETFDMSTLYSINIRSIYKYVINEKIPFLLICTYLFFEYVRPQTIYPSLDVIPWGFLILILTALSVPVFGLPRYSASHPFNKLMVAYLLVVILSSFFSYDTSVSWASFRMFFDWFLIYFLIIFIVDTPSRYFVFMLSFLIYSYKMSQHGFLAWAAKGFAFDAYGVSGAPGWFQNSGELGIQMAIFTSVSLYFIWALKKYWGRFTLLFFLTLPFTAIGAAIASSSRGALLGIGAAFMWQLMHSKRFFQAATVLALVGILVYNLVPEGSMERFERSGNDHTSLHRMERWRHGWDAMTKNPILGVGHNAWNEYYITHYTPEQVGPTLVHNIFVQCGSELGFSGLFVFLLMILFCFKSNKETRKYASVSGNDFHLMISRGLDAALVGYLASASFVTVQYYPYFWIHAAFVVCLRNISKREFESQRKIEKKRGMRAF